MSKKSVLITGASGLLGRAIYSKFNDEGWSVIGTAYSRVKEGLIKLDLTNTKALQETITKLKPSIIIHSAAQRFPNMVENNFEEARKLNVESTKELGKIAASLGIPVVYISTDYVFDGKNAPYKETDKPNPVNKYGQTKYDGEKAITEVQPDALILRIPVLYGNVEYLQESAVTCLLEILLNNTKATVVSDYEIKWPSHVNDISTVCFQLAEKKLQNSALQGCFQWNGKEAMTKYQMVKLMSNIFNLPMDHIKPDSKPTEGVVRPYNCQLSTKALDDLGIGQDTPFCEGIKECLKDFITK